MYVFCTLRLACIAVGLAKNPGYIYRFRLKIYILLLSPEN